MTVAQLARRSGLAPSALRYYETVGLVRPARAENGYRTYDEDVLDRLRFVAAAKRMGLDLATIAGLLRSWETGPCADVKTELRPAVEARLTAALAAEDDARTLIEHLRASLEHLDQLPDSSDRCSPACASATRPASASDAPGPVEPVGCSLDGAAHHHQVQRWRELVTGSQIRRSPSGVLIDLPLDRLPIVADLLVDELRCCTFLDVDLRVTAGGARMTISAPPDGQSMIDELLHHENPERST